ncbi:MAG: exodeoxyribonuclease VII large subunit, partial [Planctomycetota bacterium]|nr:exodeoxyribonuclease VII large subunit [Planctomycetota bacterium]
GSRLERGGPFARVGRAEERVRALAAALEGAVGRAADRRAEALGRASRDLVGAGDRRARSAEERLRPLARTLAAVSPHAVLERGYSITRRADGSVVGSAGDLTPGERLSTLLARGEVESEVTDIRLEPGAEERG